MTFYDKYINAGTWREKATIMGLYHIIMSNSDESWTITKTAQEFSVSIGLVSENLKLANALDKGQLKESLTRQQALDKLRNHHG